MYQMAHDLSSFKNDLFVALLNVNVLNHQLILFTGIERDSNFQFSNRFKI
jgi:hypothetical protein